MFCSFYYVPSCVHIIATGGNSEQCGPRVFPKLLEEVMLLDVICQYQMLYLFLSQLKIPGNQASQINIRDPPDGDSLGCFRERLYQVT